MREIIFRAKSLKDGSFVYGHYLQIEKTHFIQVDITKKDGLPLGWLCDIDKKTLGQYTNHKLERHERKQDF